MWELMYLLSNEVIAALAGAIVGALLSPIGAWFLDCRKEKKQQKELLENFKLELICNYDDSEFNRVHAQIETDLPMNRLNSDALEGLWKRDWFPKSWDKEAIDDIAHMQKSIRDLNRGIMYRKDTRVRMNEALFSTQNKFIVEESENLSFMIHHLNLKNLDDLGTFLKRGLGSTLS